MEKIKVYLDTTHNILRESVHSALDGNPGTEIFDDVSLDRMTFPSVEDESPIIAVLDIGEDEGSRLNTIRRMKKEAPAIASLVLSDEDSNDLRYAVLKSGANAFLTCERVPDKLNKTIEELSYGYLPIMRSLLRAGVASLALDEFHKFSTTGDEADRPDIRLSFQQRTLLQYIANGHNVPQLVKNLGVNQNNIREQLEHIREKLVEIDKYLISMLQPAPIPPALEEEAEAEVKGYKEPSKVIKTAKKLLSKLKQVSLDKITPALTVYPRKVYKGIFRPTVSRIIILFIVMIIGFFLSIHLLPGHNMYVVSSESMKPTINIGDIIVTRALTDETISSLASGDIITFDHGKNTVTHRLLDIDGEKLTTKGDAAEESDAWTITLSEVKDVYLFRIPFVGYIPQLAKEKFGWFLMIVLPAALLVGLLLKDIIKEALRNDKSATEKQGGGVPVKS